MTESGKRFWTRFYLVGALIVICLHTIGCVELQGGSSSGTTSAENDADTTSTSDQTQTQE